MGCLKLFLAVQEESPDSAIVELSGWSPSEMNINYSIKLLGSVSGRHMIRFFGGICLLQKIKITAYPPFWNFMTTFIEKNYSK